MLLEHMNPPRVKPPFQTDRRSSLVALWTIFKGQGGEALVGRKSRLRAPAGLHRIIGAMVSAMSKTVADLNREIAGALRTLATQTTTR